MREFFRTNLGNSELKDKSKISEGKIKIEQVSALILVPPLSSIIALKHIFTSFKRKKHK